MSCNYCWNQPKKYERYDLYLDGKIKADDFVYRTKDAESGEISTTTLSEKIGEIESRLQTHFTFEHVTELPTEGKETVIYLVPNAETSGDKDGYDEYMWDVVNSKFELIGSGSYAKQQADLDKEIADRIADVDAEEERATDEEKRIEEKLIQEIEDREADVNAEEERAKGEEERIEEKLDQEIADRNADVNAEEERAIEEEKKLAADIERFSGNVLTFYNNIDDSISLKNFDGTASLSSYNAGGTDLTIG